MKPTLLIILLQFLSLLICNSALAEHSGPYIGAYGGGNLLQPVNSSDAKGSFTMTYKPAVQYGAVIGWNLGKGNFLGGEGKVEVEYMRRNNRLEQVEFVEGKFNGGGSLTVDSLLLSSYYVHRNKTIWSPYIGVGAGAARVKADTLQVTGQLLSNDSNTVFAYQLGTGIDISLGRHVSFDLGYRFFGCSTPKLAEPDGSKFKADYFSHTVALGLRFGL